MTLALLVSLAVIVASIATGSAMTLPADAAAVSPTAVNLGAASGFSILGSSVSNTNASTFEFDVGASPGAIVGFPPGITSGKVHRNDQAAINASAAVQAAYVDASGRTATATIGGDLIGVTLTPGVYSASAALSNTGTLTLDGQGDSHAVFIIQIDAAFNMAATATVRLVNGATAAKVFWQVAGAVTFGSEATFSGILLGNAAITIGADDTLIGAVLSRRGAVSIDGSSVSASSGFNGAGSAPQLIPLGTAGNFSILGNSVNNTDATNLNRDVGAYPGAISGFPPGTTSGTIHTDDSQASQALDDLSTAYSTAATRSKTATIVGDLAGLTFTSGVYRATAAISNTGTVTLDGHGDPSAVFTFQIRAALTIDAGARVILINDAQPGNVFWQVAGATTVGAGAEFAGIILGNAAITLGANVSLAGAALTQSGAVNVNFASIATTPGYSGSLSFAASGSSFPNAILSGLSTVINDYADTQWSVTDERASPTPWDLNVTATMPTSAAGSVDTTARSFAAGSLTITPGIVTAQSGDSAAIRTQTVTLSGVAQRIAWSAGSRGTFLFTPTLTLTIPANAYRSNFSGPISEANPNPYVSTITVTIG